MSTTTFRHVETRCPQCDYKMDSSSHVHGGEPSLPKPGDASVCINCGQVLMYEADCRLRKATVKDIGEIMGESPEAWAAIEKAQLFIRLRGRFA